MNRQKSYRAFVVTLSVLLFACGQTPADDATQTDNSTGTDTVVTTGIDVLSRPSIESGISPIAPVKDPHFYQDKPENSPPPSSSISTSSFTPSSIPPDPSQNSNTLVINAPGTDFDFTGAQGVAKIRINQSTSEYKKIDLSGSLIPIGRNAQRVVNLKRVGPNRLLLQDDSGRIILVGNDGTEVELTSNNFDAFRPNPMGDIFYSDQSAQLFRIASNSSTMTMIGSFPFDQIHITDVSGPAVTYYGYSGSQSTKLSFFDSVNFSVGTCSSVVTLADIGLISSDCNQTNFTYWDGSIIQKERLNINAWDGFWHPDGAVVFTYNSSLSCNYQAFMFIDRQKSLHPIGCSPEQNFAGYVASGDFFVIRGQSFARAYGINSWQQDVLTNFTPTKLSLTGTTLFYDGLSSAGSYMIGKVDIITKQQSYFNFGTTVQDLIGFQ